MSGTVHLRVWVSETNAFVWRTGHWQDDDKKLRTCSLSGRAHVGANWRLRVRFVAAEDGSMRVWNEEGATFMDVEFVADELWVRAGRTCRVMPGLSTGEATLENELRSNRTMTIYQCNYILTYVLPYMYSIIRFMLYTYAGRQLSAIYCTLLGTKLACTATFLL